MSWSTLRRPTAILTLIGLFTVTSSGFVMAAAPSTLSGRVVTQDSAAPRSGVVVTLIEPASERAYRSSPTDTRGAFTIDAAPAGNYAVVVEAPEGAFLASNNLQLAPGVNRPVSLALKPGKQGEPPAGSAPAAASPKSGTPTWAKWVIAGGVIIGAALVIDAVTKDSNNNEASGF